MNENQVKFSGMAFLVDTDEPCNIYSIGETLFSSPVTEPKDTGRNLYVVMDERPFKGDYFLIPDDKFGVILHKCIGEKEKDSRNSYFNGFILNENNLMYTPNTCYRVVASSSISDKLPVVNLDMITDWVDIYRFHKRFGLNMTKLNNQPLISVDVIFKDQTLTDVSSMELNLKSK
jgi:hypothetical protein